MNYMLSVLLATVFLSQNHSETHLNDFRRNLSEAAIKLTYEDVIYDPAYYSIPYPGGDVPSDRGVCTDVIIRAYRALGIDLQKNIHEDMKENFFEYPGNWGLSKPDKNIDHRRVPNQMMYFSRKGIEKAISRNATNYHPGDIVAWKLNGGATHIGIVIKKKSEDGQRYLVVHNIGNGQEISDCLFEWEITGHYYYEPNID